MESVSENHYRCGAGKTVVGDGGEERDALIKQASISLESERGAAEAEDVRTLSTLRFANRFPGLSDREHKGECVRLFL